MAITITRTGANTVIAQTGLSNISISASTEVEITYNDAEEFINILLVASTEPPIALEVAEITTVNGVNVTAYTIAQLAAYISANCFGLFNEVTGDFKVSGNVSIAGDYTGLSQANRGYLSLNGADDNIIVFSNNVTADGYIFHNGTNLEILNAVANGSVKLYTNSTARLTVKETGVINIANIPTSAAGLITGDVWSDGGILKIV